MNMSLLRKTAAELILGMILLTLVSCSSGGSSSANLDGFYHGVAGGPITLNIKGGKATFGVGNESKTLDYKVEGKKLTLIDPTEGNIVFTINDDGTLNSELGIMTRKSQ